MAPAAAMVSLASFGANAAPASAGIATTTSLADALSLMKFADGGFVSGPGTWRSDSIFAQLSNGEFVVNAASTANNRGLLEAINSSQSAYVPQTFSHSGSNVQNSRTGERPIEVHNYGPQRVEIQQDDNRIRMIVRQEGPNIVQQHAPKVIATDIANPNSQTSKAIAQNTTATRNR